jgi:hypothetical protein
MPQSPEEYLQSTLDGILKARMERMDKDMTEGTFAFLEKQSEDEILMKRLEKAFPGVPPDQLLQKHAPFYGLLYAVAHEMTLQEFRAHGLAPDPIGPLLQGLPALLETMRRGLENH